MSTHSHWAIRNWEENPRKLTPLLLNIVEHYKYNQQSCHVSSRCKKDPNYEISRKVITDPKAEKLLLDVLRNADIFKYGYRICKDTYFVERFNYVVNIYYGKRIPFSNNQCSAKAKLSVCHWNKIVEREVSFIWKPNQRISRYVKERKLLKYTFTFRENIWKSYLVSFFRGKRKKFKIGKYLEYLY